MVIENPMQFTIVRAVPLSSTGALWATIVEKSGESVMTVIPQKSKKTRNRFPYGMVNASGEMRQQHPERKSAVEAIFLVPKISDI